MLVPGLEYNFETIVECVSDLGISDQLYVFITKDKVSFGCPIYLKNEMGLSLKITKKVSFCPKIQFSNSQF